MKRIISGAALIIIIIISVTAYYGYSVLFKSNTSGKEAFLLIPHGSDYNSIIDSLNSMKVIKNMGNFKKVSRFEGLKESFKPGRYRIKPGMGNRELIRAIKYGWQTPLNITISGNIRTKEKLASVLARKIECDSASMADMLNDKEFADSLGFRPETFIAMFLPNTYEFYWTVSPRELALRFKKEYDKFWNTSRMAKAKSAGLTPEEVITLASIVSEESNLKKEYPIIAGVYLNRLKKGVPLQADPTVKFAVKDPSIKRILFKHLKIDSPYNTYKYRGLPPGPITIPSVPAIDGVLDYENHKFLYFCAKPELDGSHKFAVTLDEHHRNARAYQKAINKLKL